MLSLTAVTIGIGSQHEALAKLAAARMRKYTGLDARILGPTDLAASGLADPCHLKFRLFDLVDAENILYFDADAFCLRPWAPRAWCDRPDWTTVRGYWFDPWVEHVGRLYGFGDTIVAGGFFLINRRHHLPVLRLAETLQPAGNGFHGRRNPDEIALASALAVLCTPIAFVDRRFNWLRYGEGNLGEQGGAVIAHACDAALRRRYLREPLAEHDLAAAPGEEFLPDDLAGKTFIYDRVGHDLRPLELRYDGTVGRCGGGAERFWFVVRRNGRRTLVITAVDEKTCALVEDERGVWRGRWSGFERMPVTLEKHRAQVLLDVVRARVPGVFQGRSAVGDQGPWGGLPRPSGPRDGLGRPPHSRISDAGGHGPLRGAEIGVYRGETSALLLAGLPNLQLYMIDPWRQVPDGTDYRLTGDECAAMSQAGFDDAMARAADATGFAAARRTIVACDQSRAAPFVPDQLDFVFIDGDHSFGGTLSAIETWWPKLAPGGLLAGHDYDHPHFPGVRRAVQEFAGRENLRVSLGPDRTWWYGPPDSRTVHLFSNH